MKKNNQSFATPEASKGQVHGQREDKAPRSNTVENRKVLNRLESKPSMDINESAEAFIKKFREQLMIQRLESIEKNKKMLAKGL